jgi:hypothetical protein
MRSSLLRIIPSVAPMMAIGGVCVLVVIEVVAGVPHLALNGLCTTLVLWYVLVKRREGEVGVNRPPRTVARQPLPRRQVRPEHHPLWDRWLDG